MTYRTLAMIAALAGTGCTGEIGAAGASGTSSNVQGGSSGSVDSRGTQVTYAPAYVLRLTQTQYVNGVRDLLGDVAATAAEKLELDDPVGESDHTFRTMRATTNGLVDIAAEHVSTTAFDVAHAAASDTASRATWLGCNPKAASDDCVKSGIGSLLRRAYRRTLTSDESGKYVSLMNMAAANEGNDVWKGIEAALAAMLQSPNFLFSVNVGESDPNVASRVQYSGYEMAGRMALLLWDSVPDNALMVAADSGALVTAEGIRNEAGRLLADPRARRGTIAFGTDLL